MKVDFVDSFGTALVCVHKETPDCARYGCTIHAPSDHHMKDWPLLWRNDRGIFERIDPMGCGHPDPDMLSFYARAGRGEGVGVHGCTGLCNPEKYAEYLNEKH